VHLWAGAIGSVEILLRFHDEPVDYADRNGATTEENSQAHVPFSNCNNQKRRKKRGREKAHLKKTPLCISLSQHLHTTKNGKLIYVQCINVFYPKI